MTTVRQLLDGIGRDIWSVSPDDVIIDAMKLMAEKNVGALVVIRMGKAVGIISERDIVRKVELEGKTPSNTRVREIMTRDILSISPNNTIDECMALMTEKRIRHLPVYENDRVTGVISIGDIVKSVISEKEFIIEQLESYITGS